nr:transposase [uncultured bacterium]
MEAAERGAQGDEGAVIAHDLRVGVRSVQRWRRAWPQDGPRALAFSGPASLPLLSDELFAVLEQELAKGAGGARLAGPDLDPVTDQDPHRAPVPQELHRAGCCRAAQRHGWSCQMPARRAVERDEAAVTGWVKETWPSVEGPWRRSMPGSSRRTGPASR